MLSFRLTQSCVVDLWNYPLLAFRILLCGWSAQQPSLRWEFNASSLSHLLRVPFWLSKGHKCDEMRAHNARRMLQRDDQTWQVIYHFPVVMSLFQPESLVSSLVDCDGFENVWILSRFCCPICSRSVIDMSKTWQRLDEEVSSKFIVESFKSDRSFKLVAEEY